MQTVYPNLWAAMTRRGVSVENIADAIGLSEESVHLKLEGVQDWRLSEALAICRYLQYPDLRSLFLR